MTENEALVYEVIGYVNQCFKDSFATENRSFNGKDYDFKFIIVTDKASGDKILYPVIFWCRYARVKRHVVYKLENNLFKKFGLHYIMTETLCIDSYNHTDGENGIDPNHTVVNIKVDECGRLKKTKYFWISAICRNYNNCVDFSKPIPAKKLYQLTLTHFNYTPEQLKKAVDNNETVKQQNNGKEKKEYADKIHLPNTIFHDWTAFKLLYNKAFGCEIGSEFEFEFGPNIEMTEE